MMLPLLVFSHLLLKPAIHLEPVPFTDVRIEDRFWKPRQEINRTITIDHSLKMLEQAGNFDDMKLAAEGKRTGYKGLLFTDSDLYKVMEGIAYSLATHPDPALIRRMDEMVELIAAAQRENGYINTWHQVVKGSYFDNLRDEHELYCAGHMFEGAVAYYQATGKRNFLDVALKEANLIWSKFGTDGKAAYPGHPEIELALIKLWRATGDQKWFILSKRFIDDRGNGYFAQEHNEPFERYDGTYWIDDKRVCDQDEIKGHAVRAAYLMTGAADVTRESGDPAMLKMLNRVWRSATERRVFITGGIGPSGSNEGFTTDYDLPNMSAYQETCASIAMALWGNRMGLLFGDAKYADAVEKALYNGMLSGVGLDGKSFFYVNPLASMGSHHRQPWFSCACCPPNVLRTIAAIGGYAYAKSNDSLFVNLYIGGSVSTRIGDRKVSVDVSTDYPWDGKVTFKTKTAGPYGLHLRIPGWCRGAKLSLNGSPVRELLIQDGYVVVQREWRVGDRIVLDLPMPVLQMQAHPLVKEDIGQAAIQRGPLVYCVEQVDNATPVDEIIVPRGAKLDASFRPNVLGGVVVVTASGERASPSEWRRTLYQPVGRSEPTSVTLVPYGYWDNRKPGRMEVWIPTVPPPARILGPEGKAQVTLSFRSGNAQPRGVNDGIEPTSSGQQPNALCHFWPHKGGEEWIQYSWKAPMTVSGSRIYWFDDTGRGECRLPQSWKLQAMVGGVWQDIRLKDAPVALDRWCDVTFDPVTTAAIRLVIRQKDGWASGVHEWKILTSEDD